MGPQLESCVERLQSRVVLVLQPPQWPKTTVQSYGKGKYPKSLGPTCELEPFSRQTRMCPVPFGENEDPCSSE